MYTDADFLASCSVTMIIHEPLT